MRVCVLYARYAFFIILRRKRVCNKNIFTTAESKKKYKTFYSGCKI